MKKFLWMVVFLTCTTLSDAAPQLTINSYFPAPSGAYQKLRLTPQPTLSGSCSLGTLYFDSTSNTLKSCQMNALGTDTEYAPAQGVWMQQGNDIFLSAPPADPKISIIGTADPTKKFVWFGEQGALRTGSASWGQWADANIGNFSVALGDENTASGLDSGAFGGFGNNATQVRAVTVGGESLMASGDSSAVIGGQLSEASGFLSAVIGGGGHLASGAHSFIAGGNNNTASGDNSAVIGGETNIVSADYSGIIAGRQNQIDSSAETQSSVIVGGSTNHMLAGTSGNLGAGILGGSANHLTKSDQAVMLGGDQNELTNASRGATVGGLTNKALASDAVVVGGNLNTASGGRAVVVGGASGTASGANSLVGGGSGGEASGESAISLGGGKAQSDSSFAVFGRAQGANSIAIGGESYFNGTTNDYSAVIGGYEAGIEDSQSSFIAGGYTVTINGGARNGIIGGFGNFLTAAGTSGIFVGSGNRIDDFRFLGGIRQDSAIIGGNSNALNGQGTVILGGLGNEVESNNSIVGGSYMTVSPAATNTFVFGRDADPMNPPSTVATPDAAIFFPGDVNGKLSINEKAPQADLHVSHTGNPGVVFIDSETAGKGGQLYIRNRDGGNCTLIEGNHGVLLLTDTMCPGDD